MNTTTEQEQQTFYVIDKRDQSFLAQISLLVSLDDDMFSQFMELAIRETEKMDGIDRQFLDVVSVPSKNKLS